jgi:hypothetical protein
MESLGADGGRRPAIKESLLASERPESKRFLTVCAVSGRPAAPFRGCGAPGGRARPPQRSPQLYAAFRPPRAPRTVKTINRSRWRGLKRESEHRLEPMEGIVFFFKNRFFARCARNQRNRLRADAPALIDALHMITHDYAWVASAWW